MFVDEVDTLTRLLAIAGGVLTLFIGVAMISPKAVPPLASVLSPIAKWLMVVLSVVLYPLSLAAWLVSYGLLARGAPAARRIAAGVAGGLFWVAVGVLVLAGLPPVVALVTGAVVLAIATFLIVRAVRGGAEAKEFPSVRPDRATSGLSRENSRRNPGRTAATAAALMIGIALVSFVAVLAEGMKQSNRGAIEDQVKATWVVTSQDGFTPFVAAAGDSLDEVDLPLVTDVRSDLATVAGSDRYLTGIEPGTITQAYTFDWVEGSDDVLADHGRQRRDRRQGLRRGQEPRARRRLRGRRAERQSELIARVVGIYKPPPFYPILGHGLDSEGDLRRRSTSGRGTSSRSSTAANAASSNRRLAAFPDAKLQTREEWITSQDEEFNEFLTSLYVLLALSVIVSIFGMINTLVLSVFERTRELGMLRAVGMTRLQVRRMVRHESVITALIGAALGLPLGIFLAALVTKRAVAIRDRVRGPADAADHLRDRLGDRRRDRGDPARPARLAAERAASAPVRVTSAPVRWAISGGAGFLGSAPRPPSPPRRRRGAHARPRAAGRARARGLGRRAARRRPRPRRLRAASSPAPTCSCMRPPRCRSSARARRSAPSTSAGRRRCSRPRSTPASAARS